MSRYIDADKLWNDRPQCPRGQSQEYDKGFWDCIFRFSELIHNSIKNSTADVVEVVRCKDCKHRYVPCRCALWFGMADGKEYFVERGEDFYCSYGERREK